MVQSTTVPQLPLVIVVHTNPTTRQVISQALENDAEVLDATSIQHALELALQAPPDILFVGDMLPDGTPAKLIRRLRRTQGDLVVIQLTQGGAADYYLSEPVSKTEILDLLHGLTVLKEDKDSQGTRNTLCLKDSGRRVSDLLVAGIQP